MYVIGRNDYGQYSQETQQEILCNRSRKRKRYTNNGIKEGQTGLMVDAEGMYIQ